MKKKVHFAIGDWVAWNDDDGCYDDDDLGNLMLSQMFFSEGPFMVSGIIPVAEEDVPIQKHSQYLQLTDESGEPVMNSDGAPARFSGYWFVEIPTPPQTVN